MISLILRFINQKIEHMKQVVLVVLGVALLIFGVVSCKKYEDGGLISKAEKNLTASKWVLSSYYRNGNDETSQLVISSFREKYDEGGKLTREFIDSDDEFVSEEGGWEFEDDKEVIKLSDIGSFELSDETSTVSSSKLLIVKLEKDSFWYSFSNGGDEHEFHFVAE